MRSSGRLEAARISDQRSVRAPQREVNAVRRSSSDAPRRISDFRSKPWVAKRHVNRRPSADRRSRVQVRQKGRVTDAITPISPSPSA